MHFYWGDSPMSWLRYMTLKTFRTFNPGTRIVLHSGAVTSRATWATSEGDEGYDGLDWRTHLDVLGVEHVTYEPLVPLPPQQACDLCRWEILAAGGLFADMDIVWTRPFPFIGGDAVSCDNGILKMGVMSGAPGGVFARVRDLALERVDTAVYQSIGVAVMYEVAFGHSIGHANNAKGRDTLAGLGVANIPMWWVHPLSPMQMDMPLPRRCVGLHWYGGWRPSIEASRTMTPANWRTFTGAIPDALVRGEAAWSR
jgi:hypothetical protein